jgi:hypothetical protein
VIVSLRRVPAQLAVCRLSPEHELPAAPVVHGALWSVTRTATEVSVICDETMVPEGAACERGFVAFTVPGRIPFSATGVMAALVVPLAEAHVSVVPVGTFDTDYVLLRASDEVRAIAAWRAAGIPVDEG